MEFYLFNLKITLFYELIKKLQLFLIFQGKSSSMHGVTGGKIVKKIKKSTGVIVKKAKKDKAAIFTSAISPDIVITR